MISEGASSGESESVGFARGKAFAERAVVRSYGVGHSVVIGPCDSVVDSDYHNDRARVKGEVLDAHVDYALSRCCRRIEPREQPCEYQSRDKDGAKVLASGRPRFDIGGPQ